MIVSENKLTLSVILPTLNRPKDITRLLLSILTQSRAPDELIVVDQSANDDTKNIVYNLLEKQNNIKLNYIHDSSFNGLVQAKSIGVKSACSDIICFLDDDTVLDKNYLKEIANAFWQNKNVFGTMGIITNPSKQTQTFFYRYTRYFCFRGIFADPRPQLLANIKSNADTLIPCRLLSGGTSAWRKEILHTVPFDKNNLHYFEDTDYSDRAARIYGAHFYINTKAKLEHWMVQNTRPDFYLKHYQKLIDGFIFYKKRANQHGAKRGLTLILICWFLESLVLMVKYKTFKPVAGYLAGIKDGRKQKIVV